MSKLIIDQSICTGCGLCLPVCLYGALEMAGDFPSVDADSCTLCGACLEQCPSQALSVEGSKAERADKADYHGIWVYGEQWQGRVHGSACELLTEGRRLAKDLAEPLSAVLIGHQMQDSAKELQRYGAGHIYLIDDPALATPDEETYARLLTGLIRQHKPAIVLYAATAFGRSLAPRAAAQLKTGLTADCTGLEIDPETKLLRQTRPAFGGNVMATILCPEQRPQMATVRPKVFKKQPAAEPVKGDIIDCTLNLAGFMVKSRILEVADFLCKEQRVEDADIVVAGGAGFASPREFELVRELAGALGGCVGASRAAVDLGYAPHCNQVGQTGKVIAPKLYIACGISGAIQHMVGMENAETIIAINHNPDGPIFQIADIGLVGDIKVILPLLTAAIRERRSSCGIRRL